MKTYTLVEHTADIRLHVEASTVKELFTVALEGMSHIIAPHQCLQQFSKIITINITSGDTTTLLIDFLSEVLTNIAITKMIFCKVTITHLTTNSMTATIHGHPIPTFAEDIKAVTYHEAEVKKNNKGDYETTIVFDV